jgi:hypothetical protein
MSGETQLLEPTWVSKNQGNEHRTSRGFAERYKIARQTLDDWLKLFRAGLPFDRHGGKPSALDETSKQNIRHRIKDGVISTNTVLNSQLAPLLSLERKATMIRRGKRTYDEEEVGVSASFVYKYRKAENIRFRVAQDLSDARRRALEDVRLMYRIACMFDAFSGHLPAEFKWNADATTAIVSETGTGALVCTIEDKQLPGQQNAPKRRKKKLDSSVIPSSTNLLVKWMFLCSALGDTGPLTLIVAVPEMPEGAFFASKVKSMSGSSELGAQPGWLYFCNSRAGNAELWRHWFAYVLIPTLEICKDMYCESRESAAAQDIFFSTDGEAIILNEAFDSHVLNLFDRNNVTYGKNGPSATSKTQAADVADTFRDWKTGLRYHTAQGTDTHNSLLQNHLDGAFSEFRSEFPDVEISAPQKTKIKHAVEKIVFVLRSKYVTPEKIVEGFIRTGQHVRRSVSGKSTVNYDLMMGLTLAKGITKEEMEHMRDKRPDVIEEFRKNGRVETPFLDKLEIVASPDAKNRDDLTLCQQDCQIITHEATVARVKASKLSAPAVYSSPPPTINTVGTETSVADVKKADKFFRAEEKKEATAAKKKAEKERVASLTPQQRAEEVREKKAEQAAKKAAKEADYEAKKAHYKKVKGIDG